MLNHQGTLKIETTRLILRQFTAFDAVDMFNNWANDTEVTKYLSWAPHQNMAVTENVLNSWIFKYGNKEVYHWAIAPKGAGEVVGSISVVDLDNKRESCEIGYCIGKAYWNKGITTEALKAVIDFMINEVGFLRVQAKHDIANPASGRVMLKAGMSYEGRLRKYHRNAQGKLVDCDMYSAIGEDGGR